MRCQDCRNEYLPSHMIGFCCRNCDRVRVARRKAKEVRQPRMPAYDAATLAEIGKGTMTAGAARLIEAHQECERAARTLSGVDALDITTPVTPAFTLEWLRADQMPHDLHRRMLQNRLTAEEMESLEPERYQFRLSADHFDYLRKLGKQGRRIVNNRRGTRPRRGGKDISLPLGALLHLYRTNTQFKELVDNG